MNILLYKILIHCHNNNAVTLKFPSPKIEVERRKENPIPEGWALDKEGQPTTNAKEAMFGALMPLGGPEMHSGYKGYGLGMLVEIFCGILSGEMSFCESPLFSYFSLYFFFSLPLFCFINVSLSPFYEFYALFIYLLIYSFIFPFRFILPLFSSHYSP